MKKVVSLCVLVLLVLGAIIIVKTRPSAAAQRSYSLVQNSGLIHRLVDQVYAGSFDPIQGELDTPFYRGNSKRMTSALSAYLMKRFGPVQNLQFQSAKPYILDSTLGVWKVNTTTGRYEIQVMVNKEGKVSGLWFRSYPSQPWVSSQEAGLKDWVL